MERCWAGCGEPGYIGPSSVRPACALRPRRVGVTAKELARADQQLVEFPSAPGLRLSPSALVAVTGPAGSGKSTLVCSLLGDSCPAVLFSFEEGFAPTVGERLRRLELRREDLFIEVPESIQDAYTVLEERRPRAVAFDSLSMSRFTVGDLSAISTGLRILVFFVVHMTKEGFLAGESANSYVSDVILHVEKGRWSVEKSRFQAPVSGEVRGLAACQI